jgi:hypothetical protein
LRNREISSSSAFDCGSSPVTIDFRNQSFSRRRASGAAHERLQQCEFAPVRAVVIALNDHAPACAEAAPLLDQQDAPETILLRVHLAFAIYQEFRSNASSVAVSVHRIGRSDISDKAKRSGLLEARRHS